MHYVHLIINTVPDFMPDCDNDVYLKYLKILHSPLGLYLPLGLISSRVTLAYRLYIHLYRLTYLVFIFITFMILQKYSFRKFEIILKIF